MESKVLVAPVRVLALVGMLAIALGVVASGQLNHTLMEVLSLVLICRARYPGVNLRQDKHRGDIPHMDKHGQHLDHCIW